MVTEHVIRFGHTRIAHISGIAGLYTAEKRKEGFRGHDGRAQESRSTRA